MSDRLLRRDPLNSWFRPAQADKSTLHLGITPPLSIIIILPEPQTTRRFIAIGFGMRRANCSLIVLRAGIFRSTCGSWCFVGNFVISMCAKIMNITRLWMRYSSFINEWRRVTTSLLSPGLYCSEISSALVIVYCLFIIVLLYTCLLILNCYFCSDVTLIIGTLLND